jgi:hypothetical protein
MDDDFPAAHSMDATWFAVDQDGHVGVFESGENGHVPTLALRYHDDAGLRAVLQPIVLATPEEVFASFLSPPAARHLDFEKAGYGVADSPTVLYLTSAEWAEAAFLSGQAVWAPAGDGVVAIADDLDESTFRALHEAGICRGCFLLSSSWYGDVFMARLGLYTYGDADDFRRRYYREQIPDHPLRLDQLPADLRPWVSQVQYDTLCFAQTEYLLPLAHHPVLSYGCVYLDETNTFRPVPGYESAYRTEFERIVQTYTFLCRQQIHKQGWRFAPPE